MNNRYTTIDHTLIRLALTATLGIASASTALAAPPAGGFLGYPEGFTMPGLAIGGYAGAVGGAALIALDEKAVPRPAVHTNEHDRPALRPAVLRSDVPQLRKVDPASSR